MTWWSDPSDARWWGSLLASLLLSALLTWLSIRYARRRNLLDLPGQRRSHIVATPRGGGIGIVVAAMLFFCAPMLLAPYPLVQAFGLAAILALILVGAIGWIDDHRPLSARIRLLVHFAAALILLLLPLLLITKAAPPNDSAAWSDVLILMCLIAIAATLIVWSINLHNFMDGINGLLACHAIFVFVVLGVACGSAGKSVVMWQLLTLAAATAGYLPFNFPRARIFMGDVGSGALGLLIVIAVGLIVGSGRPVLLTGVIACSGFVTDASCTLLSRMLRGRRWYSAHREHLYQWMTRSGMSHARVVAWYMAWNLCVVAPVLWWINRMPAVMHAYANATDDLGAAVSMGASDDAEFLRQLNDPGHIAAVIVYALAIVLWIFGKRWCLQKMKSSQHRHAAA